MPWHAISRRYPVLGIRDFQLLLADRLLAPASLGFSVVGVSFAVLKVTGSPADLSYVLAAKIAPMLVFSLVGGVAADRFRPQRVIIAANLAIVAGDGTFGLLMLTTRPPLWSMTCLEVLTGTGMAMWYPAATALLPQLVPDGLLQEGNSISRMAMNGGQVAGAAAGGLLVAAAGPGWALTVCGAAMTGTVPLMLAIRAARAAPPAKPQGMIRELRDGWAEFRSRTWLWVIVAQFCVVMAAWYAGFQVLGPVVARQHFGGAAAWGAITASESLGFIGGGLASLRFKPRRPMLFCVLAGGGMTASPLSLALVLPPAAVCAVTFGQGMAIEMMMVQWMVAMARAIPPGKLARVASYDALGSLMATPLGALVAGPVAAAVGIPETQFAAAALIAAVSLLCLVPRDIRATRAADLAPPAVTVITAGAERSS
ncbi:MAG: MFS transporter [Nocardiopsaceae bacterium]|nr:MFS transporter [Nocardiopsaceae bacterium]